MGKEVVTPSKMTKILQKYNFSFKKNLGQNFLLDKNILRKIILCSGINEESGVIEVGPGCGALTEALASVAKKVIAFEIDQRLLPILDEVLKAHHNVTVYNQDILKANIEEIISSEMTGIKTISVVANVPYYITTAIVMRFLKQKLPISSYTIMMQREVADRIVANCKTKEYGALSVVVKYYVEAKIVMKVPKSVFLPQPKVQSVVIHMETRSKPYVEVVDEEFFFQIVMLCFSKRRKTILNNLNEQNVLNNMSKAKIIKYLAEINICSSKRGEELSIEEFARLSNHLYNRCVKI